MEDDVQSERLKHRLSRTLLVLAGLGIAYYTTQESAGVFQHPHHIEVAHFSIVRYPRRYQ